MISHRLAIDTGMLQHALEPAFAQVLNASDQEARTLIVKMVKQLTEDPSRYLTSDFVSALMKMLI